MKIWKGSKNIAIVMVLVMLIGTLGGCGRTPASVDSTGQDSQSNRKETEDVTYLTKAEWIEGLARSFGMVEYLTTEPYFTDITEENELFPYVQAIGDMGAYEVTGIAFNAGEYVTREFAVATAVIVADVLEDTGYVTFDSEKAMPDYEVCVQFAFDNGNLEKNDKAFLEETISAGEGQLILEWAKYAFEHPIISEKEETVLQEGVVDYSEQTDGIVVSGDMITIEASVGSTLQVGDVFLIPATEEVPWAVAKKVVSVATDAVGNQTVTTETPELAEIFSSIDIEQIAVPDLSNIILEEGVTLGTSSASYDEEQLQLVKNDGGKKSSGGFSYNSDGDEIIDYNIYGKKFSHEDITFDIAINLGNPGIGHEYSTSYTNATAMIKPSLTEDAKKDWDKLMSKAGISAVGDTLESLELKKGKMYEEKGIGIRGQITLSDLYAAIDIDVDTIFDTIVYDVNALGITLNYKADVDVEVFGAYEGTIPVGYLCLPVDGICAVVVEIFVYIDGNGSAELGVRTGSNTSFRYREGKPIRYTTVDYSEPWDGLVTLDAELGTGVKPYVSVVGIPIFEVGVKSGVKVAYDIETMKESSEPVTQEDGTSWITESSYVQLTGTVLWPVVTIEAKIDVIVGETEGEIELVGADGIIETVVEKEILNEKFFFYEQDFIVDSNGTKVEGVDVEVMNALLFAPVKNDVGSITYDNFYKKEGVQNFVENLLFVENPDDLESGQEYRPGTNFYFTEGDIFYGDGSTLLGGAELVFETQEEDMDYRNYTSILYDSEDLLKVLTYTVDAGENAANWRGTVGGFADFITDYSCHGIADFVVLLQLTQGFFDNVKEDYASYTETLRVGRYGEVTFTLNCVEDFQGRPQKTLYILFEEESESPYTEIIINEATLNTFFGGEIDVLTIEAVTNAYYTTEDWPDRG